MTEVVNFDLVEFTTRLRFFALCRAPSYDSSDSWMHSKAGEILIQIWKWKIPKHYTILCVWTFQKNNRWNYSGPDSAFYQAFYHFLLVTFFPKCDSNIIAIILTIRPIRRHFLVWPNAYWAYWYQWFELMLIPNQNFRNAGAPPLLDGAWLTPRKIPPPTCYHAEYVQTVY